MSNLLDRILHDLREKRAREDSRGLPTSSTRRIPSTTESNEQYHPPNWGILFCCHNKSYFEPCSQCKRDKRRAKAEYEAFLKRHGI